MPFQVVRSIANESYGQSSNEDDLLVRVDTYDDVPLSDTANPEQFLIASQEKEGLKERVRQVFSDDRKALNYINRRLDGDSKSDIMEALNLTDTQFETIKKKSFKKARETMWGSKTWLTKNLRKRPN